MLLVLAGMGAGISATNLVIMLTFANLGYVMADVAADGYMVWMAHHESIDRRGKIQTLIYIARSIGRIFINLVIIFAFSGPAVNCPGYESDPNIPCTQDESVANRNDLYESDPDTWCYHQCASADFAFGMTIPQFAWLIVAINLASMPTYFMLFEDKKTREKVRKVLSDFWTVMKRRAVWQVMLYTMVSFAPFDLVYAIYFHCAASFATDLTPLVSLCILLYGEQVSSITFNVYIAAKSNANFVWLDLSTAQNQILNIMEAIVFSLGLVLVRQYGLNFSWRKLIWIGSVSTPSAFPLS